MIIAHSSKFGISFLWELCPVVSENRGDSTIVDKCEDV